VHSCSSAMLILWRLWVFRLAVLCKLNCSKEIWIEKEDPKADLATTRFLVFVGMPPSLISVLLTENLPW
jgi:hypothetical protein